MKTNSKSSDSNLLALVVFFLGYIGVLISLFCGYVVEIKVEKKKDKIFK
jgi:hypothetical protein